MSPRDALYRLDLDWPRLVVMLVTAIAAAAFATLGDDPLSVPRIGLDLLLSVAVAALAVVVSLGPFRALRMHTRSAAREDRAAAP